MDDTPFKEIVKVKGSWNGSWHEREAVRAARDDQLIADVNKWEVTTRTLGTALLGLPDTPGNLKIVETRYNRLAKHKLHKVVQGQTTYFVTVNMSQGKADRAQLDHLYMGAWRSSTLHKVIPPMKRIRHDEIRNMDVPLFSDEVYQYGVNEHGVARTAVIWEDETGQSDYYSIIPRCRTFYQELGTFLGAYQTQKLLVIWNFKKPAWAESIAKELRQFPEEMQNLFLICREADINPFDPLSAIRRIYIRTSDWTLHSLEIDQ